MSIRVVPEAVIIAFPPGPHEAGLGEGEGKLRPAFYDKVNTSILFDRAIRDLQMTTSPTPTDSDDVLVIQPLDNFRDRASLTPTSA